jgi:hypothetical protein
MADDGESCKDFGTRDEQMQYFKQALSRIDSALGKCAESHSTAAKLYSTYEKMLGGISMAAKRKQQKLCFVYLCKREIRKDNPADTRLGYVEDTLKEVKNELGDLRGDYDEAKSRADNTATLLIRVYNEEVRLSKDREKCIETLERLGESG